MDNIIIFGSSHARRMGEHHLIQALERRFAVATIAEGGLWQGHRAYNDQLDLLLRTAESRRVRAIVVFLGINDFRRALERRTPELWRRIRDVAEFLADLGWLLRESTGAEIILNGLYPMYEGQQPFRRANRRQTDASLFNAHRQHVCN